MLAIHLLELLGGVLVVALLVEEIDALVVEPVGRLIGEHAVLVAAEQIRDGAASRQDGEEHETRGHAAPHVPAPQETPHWAPFGFDWMLRNSPWHSPTAPCLPIRARLPARLKIS